MDLTAVHTTYDPASDLWTVTVEGQAQPLGRYGSQRSAERDARLFADFVARFPPNA